MQPDDQGLGMGLLPNPFDGRDFGHVMQMVIPTITISPPASYYWHPGMKTLNQGALGACVGFTGANWKQNSPTRTPVTDDEGRRLYFKCKEIDGIPHIEGTYSRALLEVLRKEGSVQRYLWATSPDDIKAWVLGIGPVLVGTTWRTGMFNPDANGFIRPTGSVVGGHEYLIRGYSRPKHAYRLRNSWGGNWGDGARSIWAGRGGEAWIAEADLNTLIFGGNGNWGDAIGIVEA